MSRGITKAKTVFFNTMRTVIFLFLFAALFENGTLLFGMATDSQYIHAITVVALANTVVLGMISIVISFAKWRKYKIFSLVPMFLTTICALLFVPVLKLGEALADDNFIENIDKYNSIVEIINQNNIQGREIFQLSDARTVDALAVIGWRTQDGHLLVSIVKSAGFPVRHRGYLFYSGEDETLDPIKMKYWWSHKKKILDHWYRVSD
jgi:hypothetical protein